MATAHCVQDDTVKDVTRINEALKGSSTGLLVLGTEGDPTSSEGNVSFWRSQDEVITEARVMVNPDVSEMKSYEEKKKILNEIGSRYIAERVSNKMPQSSVASEISGGYKGCGMIRVWDKTLDEFRAFEEIKFDPTVGTKSKDKSAAVTVEPLPQIHDGTAGHAQGQMQEEDSRDFLDQWNW